MVSYHCIAVSKEESKEKALIGDNLVSHFSMKVLKACKENKKKFVCLPPNATDYLHPLGVAFFGPLNRKWREILENVMGFLPHSQVQATVASVLVKQEIWRKTENGSKATSGRGSLPNESYEEEDEQNDEDSFLDEEMESLSGDEKYTVEENESFVEEDEILVEEEESSAEEENDGVFAEVDDNIENSAAEMSDDFENVISGKWILADFPVGRYRKPYVAKVIRHRTSNSTEAGNKLALLFRRFPHLKTMCTFGQLQTNRTNSMP